MEALVGPLAPEDLGEDAVAQALIREISDTCLAMVALPRPANRFRRRIA